MENPTSDVSNMKLKLEKRRLSIRNRELLLASGERSCKEVECLLNLGADANFVDSEGNTALHYGICNNDPEVVNLLLKKVTNICTENKENKTPLKIAQQNNVSQIVESVREKILTEALEILNQPCTIKTDTPIEAIKQSNFIEDTFAGNNKVCIDINDINDILNFRYKRAGAKIIYEAITCQCLEDKLKSTIELGRNSIFIVRTDDNRWITLVFYHKDNKWNVYYTDASNELVNDTVRRIICKTFQLDEENELKSIQLCIESNQYDSGILAIKSADLITLNINDTDRIQNLKLNLIEERELLANMLNEMQRTKKKIKFCLDTLKDLNRNKKNTTTFTYKNANIFVMFLETFALEDTEPVTNDIDVSRKKTLKIYLQKLKKEYFTEYYFKPKKNDSEKPDINLLSHARNYILHGSKVMQPEDLEKLIFPPVNNKTSIEMFFIQLEKYSYNIYNKIIGNKDKERNIVCNHFLANLPKNMKTAEDCDPQEVFSKFVQKTYQASIEENELQEMIFNLTVNIIPVLDRGNEKIHDLKILRNNVVHCFQEFKGLNERSKEFKNMIFSLRSKLFKYYYSKEVHHTFKVMCNHPGEIIEKEMEHLNGILKEFENNFKINFGLERIESVEGVNGSFEYKFERSVFPKKDEDIQDLVDLYLKFMVIIENMDADVSNKEHEFAFDDKIDNYNEITILERRELFEDFINLKRILRFDKLHYDNMKDDLRLKLKKMCGIEGMVFNKILCIYIEENKDLDDVSNKNAKQILNTLTVLRRLKEDYIFSNKDLIHLYKLILNGKEIFESSEYLNLIEKYNLTDTKQLQILKFTDNIPRTKTISIHVGKEYMVDIDTFKIIRNMLEVFYSSYNEYQIQFNNIKEAFNDATFLDYLVSRDVEINENDSFTFIDNNYIYMIIKKLIKVNYAAPYIASLLIKVGNDKVIEHEDLILLIETLLNNYTFCNHLEQLLSIKSDKLNLYKEICKHIFKSEHFNIDTVRFLFSQPQHVKGILQEVINLKSNEKKKFQVTFIKINKLLNSIANEFRGKRKFSYALSILENDELERFQKMFLLNDPTVLDTKYQIARAKLQKGKMLDSSAAEHLFKESNQMLKEIQEQIGFSDILRYVLYTMELIYTHVLLKQFNYQSIHLYEVVRTYSLGLILPTEEIRMLDFKKILSEYNDIKKSRKYMQLLNFCYDVFKEVDILYLFNDISYQKICLVDEYERNGDFKQALIKCKESLELNNVVHIIRKELNDPKLLLLSMSNLAYANLKTAITIKKQISKIKKECKYENTETLNNEMLNHYYEALMYNVEIYKRQNKKLTSLSHNLLQCKKNISKTLNNIAFAYCVMEYTYCEKAVEIFKEISAFIKKTSPKTHDMIVKSEENVNRALLKLDKLQHYSYKKSNNQVN